MPEKPDVTFGRRFIVPLLSIIGAGAVLGLFAMMWGMRHAGIGRMIPFCVVLVAMISGLLVLHNRVLRNYRCPQCGAVLPRVQGGGERAREYRFACATCNVIWQTGLRQTDGD
jgi:hypothetical protein